MNPSTTDDTIGGDVMLTNSNNKTTIDLLNELNNPVSLDMKKLALGFIRQFFMFFISSLLKF